jgi:hypothetical protein
VTEKFMKNLSYVRLAFTLSGFLTACTQLSPPPGNVGKNYQQAVVDAAFVKPQKSRR